MEILVEQVKRVNLLINKEIYKIDEVAQREYSIPLSIFVADMEQAEGVDITPNEVTHLIIEDTDGYKECSQIVSTKIKVQINKVLERKTEIGMPKVSVFQDLQ